MMWRWKRPCSTQFLTFNNQQKTFNSQQTLIPQSSSLLTYKRSDKTLTIPHACDKLHKQQRSLIRRL